MPLPRLRSWLGIEIVEISNHEKLISAIGAGLSILALMAVSTALLPLEAAGCVIASMGASAVLLFGVPHGPLSQPWPVLAGHLLSAFVGVACARHIPISFLAAACAVGISVGLMQQLRCIHPPGGATAFTAVMGGDAIQHLGYQFAIVPVLANAIVMVTLAVLINQAFPWRRYPVAFSRSAKETPQRAATPTHEEVIAALKSLDSFVDISEEDLLRLIEILHSKKPSRLNRPASEKPALDEK